VAFRHNTNRKGNLLKMAKEDDSNNLRQIIVNQLEKHSKIEHGINILKAGLSATVFGSVFTSLIDDYIPKTKIEKLTKFVNQIGEDLQKFKNEIDENYIRTEEFLYIFEKTLKSVMESYQEEKISGFRAILINSLRDKTTKQEEKEFFLNLLDSLTGYHFRFLAVFKNPLEWNKQHKNKVRGASMMISLSQILRECFNDIDSDTIKTIISDLYNKGLSTIAPDRLTTMLSGGGIEKLNNALTPIGKKFIEFVTLE